MAKATIITIGDELLIGQVIDTNSAWIAQRLNPIGVEVVSRLAVGDNADSMVEAFEIAAKQSNIILVTGGLGPTKDDITKQVICAFFKCKMSFHEETYEKIVNYFKTINRIPSESHKQQCYMPEIARIIPNAVGTAPGMHILNNGIHFYFTPGVPYETHHIYETTILDELKNNFKGQAKIVHKTILFAGVGETEIADKIKDIEDNLPEWCSLAYLPSPVCVRIRFTAEVHDEKLVNSAFTRYETEILSRFGNKVVTTKEMNLIDYTSELLMQKGLTLSTAESCTGGNIISTFINRPGASRIIDQALVTYSNQSKIDLLDVNPQSISDSGAVSELVVLEMLDGLLKNYKANIGVAVSGIAGPDGGSSDKPVGTVCIAWGNESVRHSSTFHFLKDRLRNIEYTTLTSINLVRLFLLENY